MSLDKGPLFEKLKEVRSDVSENEKFREYLKKILSDENLDFCEDCEKYESLTDQKKRRKMATKIWNNFLSDSSKRQVVMPSDLMNNFKSKLESEGELESDLFDQCKSFTLKILAFDSIPKFLTNEEDEIGKLKKSSKNLMDFNGTKLNKSGEENLEGDQINFPGGKSKSFGKKKDPSRKPTNNQTVLNLSKSSGVPMKNNRVKKRGNTHFSEIFEDKNKVVAFKEHLTQIKAIVYFYLYITIKKYNKMQNSQEKLDKAREIAKKYFKVGINEEEDGTPRLSRINEELISGLKEKLHTDDVDLETVFIDVKKEINRVLDDMYSRFLLDKPKEDSV